MSLCILLGPAAGWEEALSISDVSPDVTPMVVGQRVDLDRITRQRTSVLDVVVTNRSGRTCVAPLHLVIDLSQDGVVVEDVSAGPADPPYYAHVMDLSASLTNGLLPAAGTVTCQVVMVSDVAVMYSYDLRTYAHLNQDPVVMDGGPYAAILGEPIQFDASGTTDPEGRPMTFAWDFGDGAAATAPAAPHTYGRIGTYQVTLSVTDDLGGRSTGVLQVPVLPSETFAVGRTRSLNPVGHPLGGVTVTESGPGGERTLTTDSATGFVTLGHAAGDYRWRFGAEGHLPGWRWCTLREGEVAVIPNPWLAARNPVTTTVSPIQEVRVRDEAGTAEILFPAGAIGQIGEATLTRLNGQTLPGPLPVGWSPVAAFWLELPAPPSSPGTASLTLGGPIQVGETAALASWNDSELGWDVVEMVVGDGGTSTTVSVASAGTHALVVPDGGGLSPPAPEVGQPLPAGPMGLPDAASFTAEGRVEPNPAVASRDPQTVTATATVTFSSTNPIPSGLVLRCDVEESYQLTDGSIRKTPNYETFISAYQRPGDAELTTLHATFPLRPRLLLGADELNEARVQVAVMPVDAFHGAILNQQGGVASGDGVQIAFDPGIFSGPGAIEIRSLPPGGFAALAGLPADAVALAFELNLPELPPGSRLTPTFGVQSPNTWFVLARVLFGDGYNGLEPVARFESDAQGHLQDREPDTGPRLPGITGARQYVLVRLDGPQALLTGTARNADGMAVAGLVVSVDGLPWLTVSGADGTYRLIAPVGEATVRVREMNSGNQGSTIATVLDPDQPLIADVVAAITGPWIVAVDPADGATGVRRATAVTVHFSEPVNPAGFAYQGIVLLDTNAQAVVGALSLGHDGRMGSFLPAEVLAPAARYTILLSPTLADLTGLPIEGDLTSQFTTAAEAARGVGAELVIYEPGSTNCPAIGTVPGYVPGDTGVVCVEGSQGTADPGVPVIVVNYDSGETATVLSEPDGSFVSMVRASEEDLISAVFVNANGTRIEVPAGRQIFDDGRVGLYAAGGVLEADSPEGPLRVVVEPEAINTRNVFDLASISHQELVQEVGGVLPTNGQLLGGMSITIEGQPPTGAANVSLPFDPAVLNLAPGEAPEDGAFGLAYIREVDGQPTYQIVDKLRYQDGQLTSNTFPFLGILSLAAGIALETTGEQALQMAFTAIFFGNKPLTLTGHAYGVQPTGAYKAVAGAFVSLHLAQSVPSGGLPGRIQPGAVYCSTAADGVFSLVVPLASQGYYLRGTHPRYLDTPTVPVIFLTDVQLGFIEKTLTFDKPIPTALGTQPKVQITHVPSFPAPGESALVQITASGAGGAPTVLIERDSLADDFAVTVLSDQDIGFNRRYVEAGVVAPDPSSARLRITVTAAGVSPQILVYTIPFGGGFAAGPNVVLPSDPDDDVGPTVAATVPCNGATVPPGEAIQLDFSEAIDASVLDHPDWFGLAGSGAVPELTLSQDQRTLLVRFLGLSPGMRFTLTVPPTAVHDLLGNALGVQPGQAAQPFTFAFSTPEVLSAALTGLGRGGGATVHGSYLFALDREGDGSLRVYDVSDPTHPSPVGEALFGPGYPRDLALIPDYSYATHSTVLHHRDLLAVVGGLVGESGVDDNGNVYLTGQHLRIYDVTTPTAPRRVLGLTLSYLPSVVSKLLWSPPFLAYLETGVDRQQIGVINLQEMLYGFSAPHALPLPRSGIDLNGDGDYVDAGERVPIPPPNPPEFFGKRFSYTVGPPGRIVDFDFQRGYCGAIVVESDPLHPSQYRTLEFNGIPLGPTQGVYGFGSPTADLRRLKTLLDVRMDLGGIPVPISAALVCLRDGGEYSLAVIDITDPIHPERLNELRFPGHGPLRSIQERPDGRLALAAGGNILLLDPRRLALPNPAAGGLPPAVVDIVPGAGAGTFSFGGGNPAGIYGVSFGGLNAVIQTAPRMSFVGFPGGPEVVNPRDYIDRADELDVLMASMVEVGILPPARYRTPGGLSTATLSPPSPAVHHHVLVHAPGGAGSEIELALETLDGAGHPLRNPGPDLPPVRAMGTVALQDIGQLPRPCDAPVRPLTAHRLSGDKMSPYFNLYLSAPFALTYERITIDELSTLRAEDSLGRDILWSGPQIRASIDPAMASSGPLAAYAAEPDPLNVGLLPRAGAVATAFQADYIMGPNPPPAGGYVSLPDSLGLVSAHNAELRITALDIALSGYHLPILFDRTMAGQDLYVGPFGRGWDFTYNQRVVPLDARFFPDDHVLPLVVRSPLSDSLVAGPGDLLVHDGGGRTVLFRYAGETAPPEVAVDPLVQTAGWHATANAFYLPENGVFELLFGFSDGKFMRLDRQGVEFWYNSLGRLEKVQHPFRQSRHLLSYSARGELARVTDASTPAARTLELGHWRKTGDLEYVAGTDEYTGNSHLVGKVRRLVDDTGRRIDFSYNTEGVLTGREESWGTRSLTTGYVLDDACAGIVRGVERNGDTYFTALLDRSSGWPVVVGGRSMDGHIHVLPPTPNRSDALGGSSVLVLGPEGTSKQLWFDRLGHLDDMTIGSASYDVRFSEDGLVEQITLPEGNAIAFTYDAGHSVLRARANILKVVNDAGGPDEQTAEFTYDERYNQSSGDTIDFQGNQVYYTTTPDGRRIESIAFENAGSQHFTYDGEGRVVAEETPEGVRNEYGYDLHTGYPTFRRFGTNEFQFGYDGSPAARAGVPSSITFPSGRRIQFAYDDQLLLRQISSAGDLLETREYDPVGNLIRMERPLGGGARRVETREYDGAAQLISQTLHDVETSGTIRDLTTTFVYQPRKVTITYPGGEVEVRTYNEQGDLNSLSVGDFTEEYVRDGNGNLIELKRGGETVTTYAYDGQDRPIRVTRKGPHGDETLHYTYHPGGRLKSATLADPRYGSVLEVSIPTVDALGRPRQTVLTGDQVSSVVTRTYQTNALGGRVIFDGPRDTTTVTYNRQGNLTGRSDSVRNITFTYDTDGNLTEVHSTEDGQVYRYSADYDELGYRIAEADGLGLLAGYARRLDGAPQATTNSRGRVTEQVFSVLGEPLSLALPSGVAFHYAYGDQRAPEQIVDASAQGRHYQYDAALRLTRETLRNQSAITYRAFDGRRLPRTIDIPGGAVALTYDLLGRIRSQSVTRQDGPPAVNSYDYDALDRVRDASYGETGGDRAFYDYDKLGVMTEARFHENGLAFTIAASLNPDGTRKSLSYPSGIQVQEVRQPSGRLTELNQSGPIYQVAVFAGSDLPAEVHLGGVIMEHNVYDARRRTVARRYSRVADGTLLADLRSLHESPGDNQIARQYIHRGGRTDFFRYDEGSRITAALVGARPALGDAERRTFPAFVAPVAGFQPGYYVRTYGYDTNRMDLLTGSGDANPDGLPTSLFATSLEDHDGFLYARSIDGAARGGTDPLGNGTNTVLLVHDAGATDARPVPARLLHNGLSQLVRIERGDGVNIEYQSRHDDLLYRRRITQGNTTLSDRSLVYDEDRLIEEYETSSGTNVLMARYYYADTDAPVAADLRQPDDILRRYYYLRGSDESVLAVADETGAVVERVGYDVWGRPRMEAQDRMPPVVQSVIAETQGVLVVFSEPVLPPLLDKGPGTNLVVSTADGSAAFAIEGAGVDTIAFEENRVGHPFGTTWRVNYSGGSATDLTLQLKAGVFEDEWGNSNLAGAFPFSRGAAVGTVHYQISTNTAPRQVARSTVGSPFLFHGQYFDYDAGLLYLRARFYDPYTGQYLQRDPFGYEDSVNLYAAFAHNPVNFRDPMGTSFISLFKLVPKGVGSAGRGVSRAYRTARRGVVSRAQSLELMARMDPGWTYGRVRDAGRGLGSVSDDAARMSARNRATVRFNGSKYELPKDVQSAFYNPTTKKVEATLAESLAVAPISTRFRITTQRGKQFLKNSWYSLNPRASGKWAAIERTMPQGVTGPKGSYLKGDIDVWTDPDAFAGITPDAMALRVDVAQRANKAARIEFIDVRKENHGILPEVFRDALGKGKDIRTSDLFSNGGFIMGTKGDGWQFVAPREVIMLRY